MRSSRLVDASANGDRLRRSGHTPSRLIAAPGRFVPTSTSETAARAATIGRATRWVRSARPNSVRSSRRVPSWWAAPQQPARGKHESGVVPGGDPGDRGCDFHPAKDDARLAPGMLRDFRFRAEVERLRRAHGSPCTRPVIVLLAAPRRQASGNPRTTGEIQATTRQIQQMTSRNRGGILWTLTA